MGVLAVDDYRIRNMSREEASNLYEIVIECHGIKSSIFTSARAQEERKALFPDPILGNPSLGRLAR